MINSMSMKLQKNKKPIKVLKDFQVKKNELQIKFETVLMGTKIKVTKRILYRKNTMLAYSIKINRKLVTAGLPYWTFADNV